MSLRDHPDRARVVSEMHMRRMPALSPGTQMIQIVRLVDAADRRAEKAYVIAPPELEQSTLKADERHAHARGLNGAEILWERHSEASTLTVILTGRSQDPFQTEPGDEVVSTWLADAPGNVVRAVRVAVVPNEEIAASIVATLSFSEPDLVSCRIGSVRLWTDFRVREDGFGRLLISAGDMSPNDLGRLVQRVQELGNYRNLALLGLPVVQTEGIALSKLESDLSAISRKLADAPDDKALLDDLCSVAARVSAVADRTAFRLSATSAYSQIVQDRLDALPCVSIAGFQKLDEFVDRRLLPATRTCASFTARLESLSARIERTSSLLRTKVELTVQEQNVEILRSMQRTGERQLSLQHLVEGLSVAAVGYYALGLASYIIKGAAHILNFSAENVQALAVVPVLILVWLFLRHNMRRAEGHLSREDLSREAVGPGVSVGSAKSNVRA